MCMSCNHSFSLPGGCFLRDSYSVCCLVYFGMQVLDECRGRGAQNFVKVLGRMRRLLRGSKFSRQVAKGRLGPLGPFFWRVCICLVV